MIHGWISVLVWGWGGSQGTIPTHIHAHPDHICGLALLHPHALTRIERCDCCRVENRNKGKSKWWRECVWSWTSREEENKWKGEWESRGWRGWKVEMRAAKQTFLEAPKWRVTKMTKGHQRSKLRELHKCSQASGLVRF